MKHANALLRNKRIDEAEDAFGRAVDLDPYCRIAHMALGKLYSAKGRYSEARGSFEVVISHYPDIMDGYMALGELFLKQGRQKEAVLNLEMAVKLSDNKKEALTKLVETLLKGGDEDKALETCREILKAEPDGVVVYEQMGDVFTKMGQVSEAQHYYQQALSSTPKNAGLLVKFGNSYARQQRFDDARGLFTKALNIEADNVPALLGMGHLHMESEAPDMAKGFYQRLIEVAPKMPLPHYYLGEALTGVDRDGAIAAFKKAFEHSGKRLSLAKIKLANLYFDAEQYQQASQEYAIAAKDAVISKAALIGFGEAMAAMQDYPEAARSFVQALAGERELPYVRLKLIAVYLWDNRFEDAMSEIDKLLVVRRRFAEAYLLKGDIHFAQKKYQQAIDCYLDALLLKPGLAAAHFALAALYFSENELKKAFIEYHAARAMGYVSAVGGPKAEKNISKIEDDWKNELSDYRSNPVIFNTVVDKEKLNLLLAPEDQLV